MSTKKLTELDHPESVTSNSDKERSWVAKSFSDQPGLWVLAGWGLAFSIFLAWAQTQKDPTCTGPPPHDPKATVIEIRLERLCKIIALAVFGICVALDLSSTLFQVSPKKRFLSSLVLCANGISFVSYCAMLWDWFPQWKDMDGGSLEWLHIFQWGFTTPCAIVILSSLGAPMEDQNILNTQLTLKVCIYDELMIVFGFLGGFLFPSGPVSWVCLGIATTFYFLTVIGTHDICCLGVQEAGTTFEAASIRGLEWFTHVLWSTFPIVFFLHYFGFISPLEFMVSRIIVELIVKSVYSVALLTGNFCLLDTIAEIRLLSLKEDSINKQNNTMHVEKMNKALQLAVMEAEASSRLSRRFVANISHELRTPLNSVIAFSSLLLDSGLSTLHEEYVRSSLTSAEALLGIINQVLEYAKVESAGAEEIRLSDEPFHLTTLCDELVDIVSSRVASREVEFAVDIPHTLPSMRGDKFRLRQCLINLCDNAVKFAKEFGGVVNLKGTVDLPTDGSNTAMLTLEVRDNGKGIPADKLSLLFKPFSQVDSHFARQHGGTGLGLAITKKIVEAMDGSITCSSQPNVATCFVLAIPFALTAQSDIPVPPDHMQFGLGGFARGKVLVTLKEGPHSDTVLAAYRHWALDVTDNCYTALSPTVAVEILEYLNEDDFQKGILVTDYATFLALSAHSDKMRGRVLVLGKFAEQMEAIQQGLLDANAFLIVPTKRSLLYARSKYVLTSDRHKPPQGTSMRPVQTHISDPKPPSKEPEKEKTKLKVLIVEDHVVNQKVAIAMLGKTIGKDKIDVHIAENGQQGLQMATEKGHAYDLVLMDVQMPFMDGLEATRRIREWETNGGPRRYYIVAMTAHASKADARDCIAAGMDRYASKPLTLSVMNEVVNEFWEWFARQEKIQ
mmetsp:Transcript_30450/g.72106  ORF Transcript_30450/g.72106 Transcript_30450/m.72106 type:complete len:900 (+) Transcript_30450:163-2862(+)